MNFISSVLTNCSSFAKKYEQVFIYLSRCLFRIKSIFINTKLETMLILSMKISLMVFYFITSLYTAGLNKVNLIFQIVYKMSSSLDN